MKGWRMSALPQAEKCGLSPALAAAHPDAPGRAGLKGVAFHARAARHPRAADALDALTADERAEVEGWEAPELPPGAVHEFPVGLLPTGRFQGHGYDGNLTEGTLDVGWREGDVAVVGDYKTGERPIEDGPLSLQLAAYGFALADLWQLPKMRLGIWYTRRGEWDWSDDIELDGPVAGDLWRRVLYAASQPPIASPGVACETCYQRGRCPERLLPAIQGADVALVPFMAGGPELTAARAAAGLQLISAMRDVCDRAEEHVRAAVRNGMRLEIAGKVYEPTECQGRETADLAALRRDGLTQYVRRGGSYLRWTWRKA